MFSEHSGAPVDRVLLDTDPSLYDLQRYGKAPAEEMQMVSFWSIDWRCCTDTHIQAMNTNSKIIDAGLEKNVRTYIMAPCIVCKYTTA